MGKVDNMRIITSTIRTKFALPLIAASAMMLNGCVRQEPKLNDYVSKKNNTQHSILDLAGKNNKNNLVTTQQSTLDYMVYRNLFNAPSLTNNFPAAKLNEQAAKDRFEGLFLSTEYSTKPEELKQSCEPPEIIKQEIAKHQNVVNFMTQKFLIGGDRDYRVITKTIIEKTAPIIITNNGQTYYLKNNGLKIHEPETKTIKSYDENDNLVSIEQDGIITYFDISGRKISEVTICNSANGTKYIKETTYFDVNGNKTYTYNSIRSTATIYDKHGKESHYNCKNNCRILMPGYENYIIHILPNGKFNFITTKDNDYFYEYREELSYDTVNTTLRVYRPENNNNNIAHTDFDYNGNILSVTQRELNSEGNIVETVTYPDGTIKIANYTE